MKNQPIRRRHCLQGLAASGLALALPLRAQSSTEDIVIGQSAHLSGPLAPTLAKVLRGQELALEEFNRKGGVQGRKVRLITLDDAYDPKRCVENVQTLIERDKVVALYGLASTANVGAVLPLLTEKKVPLVSVYTGAPNLRARHHPYFFTTMASYRDEVVQMVRNLVTLQRTQIALIYQNSPFGQLMLPVVEQAAQELGATLVAKAPLEMSGSDAVAAAQSVGAVRPQALILMAFGPSVEPAVRAARLYVGAPTYAIGIANARATLDALGEQARGLAFTRVTPYPFQQTTAVTRDYGAAMARAGLPIDVDHFFGYLNLRVLLEAMRRTGKTISPQSLLNTLETSGKIDLGGYEVKWGPQNHHGSSFVDIMVVGPGGRFIR
jgi:branched-chain amino acid transport system substrate-binding protein